MLLLLSLLITDSGSDVSVRVYTKLSPSFSNLFFMLLYDYSNFDVKLFTSLSFTTTTAVADVGVYPSADSHSNDARSKSFPELFSVARRLPIVSTGLG